MGWCHYQDKDGNCDHGNDANKGDVCCPGLLKHHLFKIPKSEVTADAIALREQLLDDLGIKSNGTAEDKLLRCSLLDTEMVMTKVKECDLGAAARRPLNFNV